MLRECRDKYIQAIQCKLSTEAYNATLDIQNNVCVSSERLRLMEIIDAYLEILYCYKPVELFVYYITFATVAGNYKFDVDVDGYSVFSPTLYPAGFSSSNGTAIARAGEFATAIDASYALGETYFQTYYVAGTTTVYIYSFDFGTYQSLIHMSSLASMTALVSASGYLSMSSPLYQSYFIPLAEIAASDDRNCLTDDEYCTIANHAIELLDNSIQDNNCCS